MTVTEKLNKWSPARCRLLAIRLPTREIARRSGLSPSYVQTISLLSSWDSIKVEVMEKFSVACGVDILSYRKKSQLMKRRKWDRLVSQKLPRPNQKRMLAKLLVAASPS